jgi:hypothetical protein
LEHSGWLISGKLRICLSSHSAAKDAIERSQKVPINFARVQEYLDKIGEQANNNPADSGHKLFWDVKYDAFISGLVPGKHCLGNNVPILDPVNKVNSAFYQILKGPWCSMVQMPKGGPYATDNGYTITLNDGSVVTGEQLLKDIEEWLAAGAPEN